MAAINLTHYESPQQAQRACHDMRQRGLSIGYIATMGALHEGHLSLVRRAKKENDVTIVSIFVNPLQFNNPHDLRNYPRDDARDIALLDALHVDAVFTGSVSDFLGEAHDKTAEDLPDAGIFARGLEGTHRPGHFEGVLEVVARLFYFVGSCRTYFGEKDYQQLQIIKQLAATMPGIDVVPCLTSREPGGLARSSRNMRLSPRGIEQAHIIYRGMQAANRLWIQGERSPYTLQAAMLDILSLGDIEVEYAELRDPLNWTVDQPEPDLKQARTFVAGTIEGVRLIDNMTLG